MRWRTEPSPKASNVIAFPLPRRTVERLKATVAETVVRRPVIYDGAWYHEEAIAEEKLEENRKRDH